MKKILKTQEDFAGFVLDEFNKSGLIQKDLVNKTGKSKQAISLSLNKLHFRETRLNKLRTEILGCLGVEVDKVFIIKKE